jgi:NitT/TauT family transport system substrate-binding protein
MALGKWMTAIGVAALLAAQPQGGARAETSQLRVATQFGIGALPMLLVQHNHLLERELAAAGLPGTTVEWTQFAGGTPMNDGLISGSLDIVSGGTTVFVALWAKARGNQAVKAIGAISALPLWLLSRNPDVRRIEDLTDKDRIAVTTVKVAVHAILLQIAADKIWGPASADRLDPLTVSLAHSDAAALMTSGGTEVTTHFSAPPFQYKEIKAPAVHRIATAQEILGGRCSYMVAYTTERFRTDNPRTYQAFVAALRDAMDDIRRDPRRAAADYLDQSKEKLTVDEVAAMIADPGTNFSLAPESVMQLTAFMFKQGLIKTKPDSWKDMFFPEVHDQPGS